MIEGGRRSERTPRPAVDLKIVRRRTVKLSLDGNGLLLAGTIADWNDFALTRWNQVDRSAAGEA